MHYQHPYSEITPDLLRMSRACSNTARIDTGLYRKYDVKQGLRDLSGQGVLAGLTEISRVIGKRPDKDGVEVPCEGRLMYRGYDIRNLVKGFYRENRFGYEEIAYLLLTGKLPGQEEIDSFSALLNTYREQLPSNFVRDIIMKAPSQNMMNVLARSVLTLYAYDEQADDISISNVLRQCLQIVSMLPSISVYGYHTYQHYYNGKSLYINPPDPSLSFSENILHMLRKDTKFTRLEARLLDLSLVLHMEHGGGNNSTFTTHVISSSATDTYSVFAASLGSLKGPKHGGANIKVVEMMSDLKKHVTDWEDEDAISAYLLSLLHRERFDHSGIIYGMGHAVYSLSDPRSIILKHAVEKLSEEKGLGKEYALYCLVEKLAPKVIAANARIYKGVSANIDFYSGFIYHMLDLPPELYTPLFAIGRSVGWSAHRIEELVNEGKIIRPSYLSLCKDQTYVPLKER